MFITALTSVRHLSFSIFKILKTQVKDFTLGIPADIQTEHRPNKEKVNFSFVHAMKTSGGVEVKLHAFLISALSGIGCSTLRSIALPPVKNPRCSLNWRLCGTPEGSGRLDDDRILIWSVTAMNNLPEFWRWRVKEREDRQKQDWQRLGGSGRISNFRWSSFF